MAEEKLFQKLMNDNVSGSGYVLDRAIDELRAYARGHSGITAAELFASLDTLFQRFPHFALLFHFINEIKAAFAGDEKINPDELSGFLTMYENRYSDARNMASRRFLSQVDVKGKTVLLHSNSSAVFDLFRLMVERNLFPCIWQTVSSPAGEGIVQAEKLTGLGFKVNLFHEDAISLFVRKIDFAVFGADIIPDNSFINKTGTYPLCLMMQRFNKPVYLLAEERKRIREKSVGNEMLHTLVSEEPKPYNELYTNPVPGVKVHNYYFEQTPLSLVKKVFTEADD